MRNFYGYIRVSTAKQGEHGVSLQEQRDAILRHAQRNDLKIASWFEERETAAKRGRPVFNQMLKLLRQGKANGVVIHKIDRSARNLKDWADLGDLIDQGVEVHFANESLDLQSRGGRLSADIQAVVAADYIRNLREESRKGFYGRIKQGLYPLPAPLGYVDKGKGKLKEPDPVKAPLVRKAFEMYGSCRYPLDPLCEELYRLGLRNRKGGRVTRTGLSVLLNNPFYIGLIRLNRTGETFPGNHKPLIAKSLFDRVQNVLDGRTSLRAVKHDFLFRKLARCGACGRSLIGEKQKGHVYYRCQMRACRGTSVREESIDVKVLEKLFPLQIDEDELRYLQSRLPLLEAELARSQEEEVKALELRLSQLQGRLNRLTDAFIDRMLEKDLFEQRKTALLMERKDIEEALARLRGNSHQTADQIKECLELVKSAYIKYKTAIADEKRDLLKIMTSNRLVEGKNVEITLKKAFAEIGNRFENSYGALERNRTFEIAYNSLAKNEFLLTGLLVAVSSTSPRLPRRTLADYGIGHGAYRRGTAGILRDLGKSIQGEARAGRCATLRLATHRALRPACETSAVGEEVFCTD